MPLGARSPSYCALLCANSRQHGGSIYAAGRQTNDLQAELAGRLAADGRMDAEMLKMVVRRCIGCGIESAGGPDARFVDSHYR